jgi:hypothetical protein
MHERKADLINYFAVLITIDYTHRVHRFYPIGLPLELQFHHKIS